MDSTVNGNGHKPLMQLKQQHDPMAERAVLGSILMEPECIFRISDFLRPEHFRSVVNQHVYSELLSLSARREPIDFMTLGDRVQRYDPPPKDGWPAYLIGLLNEIPTSFYVESYARIVEEHAIRRQMTRVAEQIGALSVDDGNIDEQLSRAESLVFSIRQGRTVDGVHTPREYVSAALDELIRHMEQDTQPGLPTGFLDLDKVLRGLKPPFPYLVAARPGMGKSAFCGNVSAHLALKKDKAVMFFAAEMTERQMAYRIWAAETGIDLTRIHEGRLSDSEYSQVMQAAGRLSESRLFIDASPGLTPGQVRARSMRYHAEHKLDLIVIDHIHRMQPDTPKAARHLELGDMMRSIVDTGKHIDVPVLVAAQLSRSLESRQNKRPQLADLRESGSLEEEAYAVLFLYRDDYYNPETSERPNICEVEISKHRDGMTGVVDLVWRGNLTRFNDLARERITL